MITAAANTITIAAEIPVGSCAVNPAMIAMICVVSSLLPMLFSIRGMVSYEGVTNAFRQREMVMDWDMVARYALLFTPVLMGIALTVAVRRMTQKR